MTNQLFMPREFVSLGIERRHPFVDRAVEGDD